MRLRRARSGPGPSARARRRARAAGPARPGRRGRSVHRPRAGPPTGRRARRARRRRGRAPFSGWIRPDEQEHRSRRRGRARARSATRAAGGRGRKISWSTPGADDLDALRRRRRRAPRAARCSASVDASIRSAHATISCSMRDRSAGSSSIPASAFTRASVWKVATSGTVELVLEAVTRPRRTPSSSRGTRRRDRRARCAGWSPRPSARRDRSGRASRPARRARRRAGPPGSPVRRRPPPGLSGLLAPDEDVTLDPGPGEGARQGAHVDAHPPAVAQSGLGQGRAVNAEDGEAATRHGARRS